MTATDARNARAIAQPADFPDELLATAASWLQLVQQKLGPCRQTAPPSAQQTAEFLAIADWGKLQSVLGRMVANRTPAAGSYGFFAAHAMREIYGEELSEHTPRPTGAERTGEDKPPC
jgi:hypothetical protein